MMQEIGNILTKDDALILNSSAIYSKPHKKYNYYENVYKLCIKDVSPSKFRQSFLLEHCSCTWVKEAICLK